MELPPLPPLPPPRPPRPPPPPRDMAMSSNGFEVGVRKQSSKSGLEQNWSSEGSKWFQSSAVVTSPFFVSSHYLAPQVNRQKPNILSWTSLLTMSVMSFRSCDATLTGENFVDHFFQAPRRSSYQQPSWFCSCPYSW
jgi:hypothetical protein